MDTITSCTASSGPSTEGDLEPNSSACGGIQNFVTNPESFMVDPGINRHVFKCLEASLKKLDKDYRVCSLMFDEMCIKEHVEYDPLRDIIIGYEDLGTPRDRKNALARKVLVFMAQGLVKDWRQPLSFYFTHDGVSADKLVVLLREVLEECKSAGLLVVSTVCDTAANNLETLRIMGVTDRRPFFFFNEKKVVALFDVPHLLTCTRDHLYKDVVHIPIEIDGVKSHHQVEWQHIRDTVKMDEQEPESLRYLKFITKKHLDPVGPDATKVSLASDVLYHRMATWILFSIKFRSLTMTALGTAKVCSEMSKLFDSLSGVRDEPEGRDKLKCAISIYRQLRHLHYWSKTIQYFEEWKYFRHKILDEKVTFEEFVPFSHNAWLQTLRGVILLWEILKISGVSQLRLGWLNLNSLENLFELLRYNCRLNGDPTASQFINLLKTSFFKGRLDNGEKRDSYEYDKCKFLIKMEEFLT